MAELYWLSMSGALALLATAIFNNLRCLRADVQSRVDLMPLALFALVVAYKWPTLFFNAEINIDESWQIAGALNALHDPVPWRGLDNTTSGPVASYVLALPGVFGFDVSYGFARAAGWAMFGASLALWYLVIRRFRDAFVAMTVVSPIALLLYVNRTDDFNHFSTELIPIFLMSLAAYAGLVRVRSPLALAVAGAAFGLVPFAKLQAAPLAIVLAAVVMAAAYGGTAEGRLRRLAALVAGGLAAPMAFAFVLFGTGTFEDAWISYILSGLDLTNEQMTFGELMAFLETHEDAHAMLVTVLVFAVLSLNPLALIRRLRSDWPLLGGSALFFAATVYVIWKPGNPWGHYLYFMTPASMFLAGALAATWREGSLWRVAWGGVANLFAAARLGRPGVNFSLAAVAAAFLAAALAYHASIGVRYPYIKWLVFENRHLPFKRYGLLYPYFVEMNSRRPPDPIVEALRSLTREDEHFAVWGYMPHYYAATGKRPSTRDVISQFQTWPGPRRPYYRARYMQDLKAAQPNIVIDANGPGNFHFKFHLLMPIEQFAELRDFVYEGYVKIADIADCATPSARIFMRRERAAELGLKPWPEDASSLCIEKDAPGDVVLRNLASERK